MEIEVKRPVRENLENQGVFDWPIWEKEVSRFDWHYDSEETCFLLEGQVGSSLCGVIFNLNFASKPLINYAPF